MYRILLIVLLIGGLGSSVLAQAGPGLVMRPWRMERDPGTHLFEGRFDATIFGAGETENDADFDLNIYEGRGRVRFDPDSQHGLAIGVDVLVMDIDSPDPRIPDDLTDQRLAAGGRIGSWEGWTFDLVAGVGFAGDAPYSDGDAWYGHATAIGTYKVDEKRSWLVMLNYDGNRAVFPDIPLPAVAYRVVESDRLVYTLGLPFSTLFWRPAAPLFINVTVAPPLKLDIKAQFALAREWRLFASFENRFDSFHLDAARDNDRVFFEQRRIEGGVKWIPNKRIDFEVAGGFAFDQEFSHGFHALDTTAETEVDDMPYVRAAVKVKF